MGFWSEWGKGHLARLRGEPDMTPKFDDATWPEDRDSFAYPDSGFGDEFDHFDEFPEDDPFMPKPTCTNCQGLGTITINEREFTCTFCGGSGCQR